MGAAVWRVRDAASFTELRRQGRRARSGPLTLTWLPAPSGSGDGVPTGSPAPPPRLAFALGRPIGTAVVRNRLRRRLRSVFAELSAQLPPGTYLFSARTGATDLDHGELQRTVCTLLKELG